MPSSNTEPAAESPKRLQIRIVDLLAWMTGTSLIMAGYQLFNESSRPDNAFDQGIQTTFRLLYSGIYGACLAGAVFVIFEKILRKAPLAPGHWLLLIQAMSVTISFCWWAWYSHWQDDRFSDSQFLAAELFTMGIYCVVGLIYLLLAGHTFDSPRWAALYVGIGLVDLTSGGFHALSAASWWSAGFGYFNYPYSILALMALVTFIWAAVVVARDVRGSIPRDGLHWTGTGVFISLLFASLLQFAWWNWVLPLYSN